MPGALRSLEELHLHLHLHDEYDPMRLSVGRTRMGIMPGEKHTCVPT